MPETNGPGWSGLLRSTVAVSLALLWGQPAGAADRNGSLVDSFRSLCMGGRPVLARIDQNATAKGWTVLRDFNPPLPNGASLRQKMWLVPLASGPHALITTEASGPAGHRVGCGIIVRGIDADAFRAVVVATLKPGAPSTDVALPNGAGHATGWGGYFGPGTTLQFLTMGADGATLSYDVQDPPGPGAR